MWKAFGGRSEREEDRDRKKERSKDDTKSSSGRRKHRSESSKNNDDDDTASVITTASRKTDTDHKRRHRDRDESSREQRSDRKRSSALPEIETHALNGDEEDDWESDEDEIQSKRRKDDRALRASTSSRKSKSERTVVSSPERKSLSRGGKGDYRESAPRDDRRSSTTSYRGANGQDDLRSSRDRALPLTSPNGEFSGIANGPGPILESEHTMSGGLPLDSHLLNQFPGQIPATFSASAFEPNPHGAAADYYNDQGQSVDHQPGIRANTPMMLHNPDTHLITPSAAANPALDTGSGSAADFYSGRISPVSSQLPNAGTNGPTSFYGKPGKKPSKTSAGLAAAVSAAAVGGLVGGKPSNGSSSNSFPPKPARHNSEPGFAPSGTIYSAPAAVTGLYTAAAGAAALGVAASAMHHSNGNDGRLPSTPSRPQQYYDDDSSLHQRYHEHKSPLEKFKDGLLDMIADPDDVRKMEAYTEYIGVCKHCFDPRSSPWDGPRRHHYHPRTRDSFESLRKRASHDRLRRKSSGERVGMRVEKESRYAGSEYGRRSKGMSKTEMAGIGALGAGAVATGAMLWGSGKDHEDAYSAKPARRSGEHERRRSRSSSRELQRRTSYGVIGADGKEKHKYVTVRGKDGRLEKRRVARSKSRSRSRDKSRDRTASLFGVASGAALGAAALGAADGRHKHKESEKVFVRHRGSSSSRSRNSSPGLADIFGFTSRDSKSRKSGRRSPTKTAYAVSRRGSSPRNDGMFGGFFAEPKPRKSHKSKKSRGFFSFASGSASSSDSGSELAFGEGVPTKGRLANKSSKATLRGSKKPIRRTSEERMTAAVAGIGVTAAALAAAQRGQRISKKSSKPELGARRHTREIVDGKTVAGAADTGEWEDELPSDATVSSGDSGLAFGANGRRDRMSRQSMDSLASKTSEDGLAAWAWRWGGKKDKKSRKRPAQASNSSIFPPTSSSTAPPQYRDASRHASVQSMQHVDPRPLAESGNTARQSSMPGAFDAFDSPPEYRPGPAPLQQPQPVAPFTPSFSYDGTEDPMITNKLRRAQTDPVRKNEGSFMQDAALIGGAAIATAGIIAAQGRRQSNVRFGLTEEQQRKDGEARSRDREREVAEERRRDERTRQLKEEAARAAREEDTKRQRDQERKSRETRDREAAAARVLAEEERQKASAKREAEVRLEKERRERARAEEERHEKARAEEERRTRERQEADEKTRRDTEQRKKRAQREAEEASRKRDADRAEREERRRREQRELEEEEEERQRQRREKQRELEEQERSDNANQQRKKDTTRNRDVDQDEPSSKSKTSSWQAPVAAGIAGALVGSVLDGARHKEAREPSKGQDRDVHQEEYGEERVPERAYAAKTVEPSHEHSGAPILDDDLFDPNFFKRKRSQSEADRQEADKVVSDLEAYYNAPTQTQAEIFAPEELLSRSAEDKERSTDPMGGNEVQVWHASEAEVRKHFEHPLYGRDAPKGSAFRGIPRLNVIAPTPPPGPSPVQRARTFPEESSAEKTSDKDETSPTPAERRQRAVSWGQDQTHVYHPQTPESVIDRDSYIGSREIPVSAQTPLDEIVVEEDEDDGSTRATRYNADDLAKSAKDRTTNSNDKYRSNQDATGQDQDDVQASSKKGPMPRASEQGPSFEVVSGKKSAGTKVTPPVRGWADDEEAEMPTSKKEAAIHSDTRDARRRSSLQSDADRDDGDEEASAPPEEDWSHLSKKERKKREKMLKRNSIADEPATSIPEPEPDTDLAQAIEVEPEEEFFTKPLSKKDKKKRDKAAKRASTIDSITDDNVASSRTNTAESPVVEPESFMEPVLSAKEKKKRQKAALRDFAAVNPKTSTPENEEDDARPSKPVEAAETEVKEDEPLSAREKSRLGSFFGRGNLSSVVDTVLSAGGIAALAGAASNSQVEKEVEQKQTEPEEDENWSTPNRKDKKNGRKKELAKTNYTDPRDVEPSSSDAKADIEPTHPREAIKSAKAGGMPGGWDEEDSSREEQAESGADSDKQTKPSEPEAADADDIWAEVPSKKSKKQKSKGASGLNNEPNVSSPLRSEVSKAENEAHNDESKSNGTIRDTQFVRTNGKAQYATADGTGADIEAVRERNHEEAITERRPTSSSNSHRDSDRQTDDNIFEDARDRLEQSDDDQEAYFSSRSPESRSRSSRYGDDDDSVRDSRREKQETKSPAAKEKKGVLGSIFGRKSVEPPSKEIREGREDRKDRGDDDDDDDDDAGTEGRRRHRRRRTGSEYGNDDYDARSTVSSTSKHEHYHRHDDQENDDERRRRRRHRDRGSDEEDDPHERRHHSRRSGDLSRTTSRTTDDQSFLGMRVEDLPPLPASRSASPTAASERVQQSTGKSVPAAIIGAGLVSAAATVAAQKKSNDGQASHEASFREILDDLPPLPSSEPSSPLSPVSSMARQGFPLRPSSSTAVPLRFRPLPISPQQGHSRSGSLTSPVEINSKSPASTSRQKTLRGRTTDVHSGEFKPLYLAERHGKAVEPVEEDLPSLPSSKPSSRASSVHNSDGDQSGAESVYATPMSEKQLRIDTALSRGTSGEDDILDSQQTTPRAGAFDEAPLSKPEPQFYTWEDLMREHMKAETEATNEQYQHQLEAHEDPVDKAQHSDDNSTRHYAQPLLTTVENKESMSGLSKLHGARVVPSRESNIDISHGDHSAVSIVIDAAEAALVPLPDDDSMDFAQHQTHDLTRDLETNPEVKASDSTSSKRDVPASPAIVPVQTPAKLSKKAKRAGKKGQKAIDSEDFAQDETVATAGEEHAVLHDISKNDSDEFDTKLTKKQAKKAKKNRKGKTIFSWDEEPDSTDNDGVRPTTAASSDLEKTMPLSDRGFVKPETQQNTVASVAATDGSVSQDHADNQFREDNGISSIGTSVHERADAGVQGDPRANYYGVTSQERARAPSQPEDDHHPGISSNAKELTVQPRTGEHDRDVNLRTPVEPVKVDDSKLEEVLHTTDDRDAADKQDLDEDIPDSWHFSSKKSKKGKKDRKGNKSSAPVMAAGAAVGAAVAAAATALFAGRSSSEPTRENTQHPDENAESKSHEDALQAINSQSQPEQLNTGSLDTSTDRLDAPEKSPKLIKDSESKDKGTIVDGFSAEKQVAPSIDDTPEVDPFIEPITRRQERLIDAGEYPVFGDEQEDAPTEGFSFVTKQGKKKKRKAQQQVLAKEQLEHEAERPGLPASPVFDEHDSRNTDVDQIRQDDAAEDIWAEVPKKHSKKEKRKSKKETVIPLDVEPQHVEPGRSEDPGSHAINAETSREVQTSRPDTSTEILDEKNIGKEQSVFEAAISTALPDDTDEDWIMSKKSQVPLYTAKAKDIVSSPQTDSAKLFGTHTSSSHAPADDLAFAATLAAGLADSGFDPDLVVKDAAYHRRASPPHAAEARPDEAEAFISSTQHRRRRGDRSPVQSSNVAAIDRDVTREQGVNAPSQDFESLLNQSLQASGFDTALGSTINATSSSAEHSNNDLDSDSAFTTWSKKKSKKAKKLGVEKHDPISMTQELGHAPQIQSSLSQPESLRDVSTNEDQTLARQEVEALDRDVPIPGVSALTAGNQTYAKDVLSAGDKGPRPEHLQTLEAETAAQELRSGSSSRSMSSNPSGAAALFGGDKELDVDEMDNAYKQYKKNKRKAKKEKYNAMRSAEQDDERESNEPVLVKPSDAKHGIAGQALTGLAVAVAAKELVGAPKEKEANSEGPRQQDAPIETEKTWSFSPLDKANSNQFETVSPSHDRQSVRDSGYQSIDTPPSANAPLSPRRPASVSSRSAPDVANDKTPLRVDVVTDPEWTVRVSKQRRPEDKLDREELPRSRTPSGETPLESTSRNRASYLFQSPPATTPESKPKQTVSLADRHDETHKSMAEDSRQSMADNSPSARHGLDTIVEEMAGRKRGIDASHISAEEQDTSTRRRVVSPESREGMAKAPTIVSTRHARDLKSPDVAALRTVSTPLHTQTHGAEADAGKLGRRTVSDTRSPSVLSNRSNGSAGFHRMHDEMQSFSRASSGSGHGGHQILRRTSMSGDLRAASRNSSLRGSGVGQRNSPKTIPFEPPPTPPSYEDDEEIAPGASRAVDMADVYQGYGDRQESHFSPTRPPSVRKRQSMHIIDLESRLDQLAAENRALSEARGARGTDPNNDVRLVLEQRELELREKDAELHRIQALLQPLQLELSRLTEINNGLTEANRNLVDDTNGRYATLQAEHEHAHQQWQGATRELDSMRANQANLANNVKDAIAGDLSLALAEKDGEIRRLREELEVAAEQIRALQVQIQTQAAKSSDHLVQRDEDYFDGACQKLCQHAQQWVLRFSKSSDNRVCRLSTEVNDEKLEARLDNAILDGSDVDKLLGDRIKRRDVFMSVLTTMIWEYVFTRYLFGMDREQRQKLKTLAKTLSEVGPPRAVAHWRATTMTLLSRRPSFATQCELDTEAVTHEIFAVLASLLPPPSSVEEQLVQSLQRVVKVAVDLSIEMRTQRAEYIMLPPLQPEYNTEGELVRKMHFNDALMNERSGLYASNAELAADHAVVKLVLFPPVVKKGDDFGEGAEEIVVCPAQVLVHNDGGKGKKVVRVMSGAMDIDDGRASRQSLISTVPGQSIIS